jgi:hypothetical protein
VLKRREKRELKERERMRETIAAEEERMKKSF